MRLVKVRYVKSFNGKKIGVIGRMTSEKASKMIEEKIVEEYNGPFTRNLRREDKLKFNLKNLT